MGNYKMTTKHYILSIVFFLTIQFVFGQRVIWSKDDYCTKNNGQERVGQKIKIWGKGGIYTDANKSNFLKWPSEEIKSKSGQNAWGDFYPQTGDTGTIIHVFEFDDQMVASSKIIYLLDIKGNYVPIGCGYLTTIDRMDENQEHENWRIKDSIRSEKYAAGCEFKTNGINSCWNRAGICAIDTISEIFTCNLKSNGVDTIILCKNIYDDGSSSEEKAYVLWVDNGKGFMKAFYNNNKHAPTEKSVVEFDVLPLVNSFFSLGIDTVNTNPKSSYRKSHSMGYSIQLYTPTIFYCDRLHEYLLKADKKHPKSKWWNQVTRRLK
jgi:hypothetical protein